MRNYKIINNYKIIHRTNYHRYNHTEIKDLKSNLCYMVWLEDFLATCYDRNSSSPEGTGYMRLFGEACVFEEDDIIPYIYS